MNSMRSDPAPEPRPEFNQTRLQDFELCPRKFHLRHQARYQFPDRPDLISDEVERRLTWGRDFHRHIERWAAGIPLAILLRTAQPPADEWLTLAVRYLASLTQASQWYVEYTLSIPFQDSILSARYDVLIRRPNGELIILDWKTGSRPVGAATLRRSMQQAVFPFVLAEAAPELGWGRVDPEDILCVYWIAAAPHDPVRIRYAADEHRHNRELLADRIQSILARRREEDFPLVEDTPENRERICALCTYAHYCDRGLTHGTRVDLDHVFLEESPLDLQSLLDETEDIEF